MPKNTMPLSSQQVRALRAEAHRLKLKPVVMIGQHGLSENVLNELESTIDHHELIKVKIPGGDKADKNALTDQICEKLKAERIQSIGNIVVLFRKHPKSTQFLKFVKS
jgi:RNA-binding protein